MENKTAHTGRFSRISAFDQTRLVLLALFLLLGILVEVNAHSNSNNDSESISESQKLSYENSASYPTPFNAVDGK